MSQVDKNYTFFKKILPTLMIDHHHEFALLSGQKIIEFFQTKRDAVKAGKLKFNTNFSVQEVSDEVVDLGFYSIA